jgi:hypothetical protein
MPSILKGFNMIYSTLDGIAFGPIGSDAAQRVMAKQNAATVIAASKVAELGAYRVTFDNGDTLTIEPGARVATGDMAGTLLTSAYIVALWTIEVLRENKRRKLATDIAINEGIN